MKIFSIYAVYHYGTPIYVGCTIQRLKRRWKSHKVRKKYPNAVIRIITTTECKKNAEALESLYIAKLGTYEYISDFGMNDTENGQSACHPDYDQSGENNPMYGRTGSKHHSYGLKGPQAPMYGKPSPNRHPVWKQADEVIELYKGGLGYKPIAKRFGCSTKVIFNIVKSNGLPPNRMDSRKGVPHPRRDPVWEHADEVIDLKNKGWTQSRIAKHFGCTRGPIRSIIEGQRKE